MRIHRRYLQKTEQSGRTHAGPLGSPTLQHPSALALNCHCVPESPIEKTLFPSSYSKENSVERVNFHKVTQLAEDAVEFELRDVCLQNHPNLPLWMKTKSFTWRHLLWRQPGKLPFLEIRKCESYKFILVQDNFERLGSLKVPNELKNKGGF